MSGRQGAPTLAIVVGLIVATTSPLVVNGGDNAAAARIRAMATLLARTPRLRVAVDCTYDVLQDSGEKIEFGERRELTLRRPDRVRVEVTRRDGSRRGIVFDGKEVTTFDLGEKVYSTVARPGTLDAALTHYTQELKMRLPLRELFASDLPQQLEPVLAAARLVGQETIDGVATDHVAFRGDSADVQLWIARDGEPLPERIVITYRMAKGDPQFAADFHDWSLNPEVPDSLFTFLPPAGAEKIPILVPAPGRAAGEKQP